MRWDTLGTFIFTLGVISLCQCMETQDHKSDKTYHFPSASLTIAGDLKDVKLKGTIAQLVRALQQPISSSPTPPTSSPSTKPKDAPSEPKPKTASGTKKIIHPSQLITKHNLHHHNKNGKTLYYGGDAVPETITVSSQSVKVSQRNTTGGKQSRHLQAFISNRPSQVKTLEGVRVPDNEEDKHYTWRNARVIKGFLVPNDRPANPHKKRQVIITDPQQYLAAAAAAQSQGATTIIDTSSLHRSTSNNNNNNGQQRASIFYAQEPAQLQLNANNNAASSLYASDTQQRSHPHVTYPNQNQQQYQSTSNNNGRTTGSGYTAYTASPQQNAMYVLQEGNSYNPQFNNNQVSSAHYQQQQAQLAHQQTHAQFFSRSGEAATAPVVSQNSQQQQQQQSQGSANNLQQQQQQLQQQTLSATIKQQYQPSIDTSAIQAAVEAVQQLEAQQAASAAVAAVTGGNQHQHQHQQALSGAQASSQQQVQIAGITQAQHQHLLAEQSAPVQTVVVPQSSSSILSSGGAGATAQEILAATAAAANGQVGAQYIQIQPSQEQSLLQLQQDPQQQQYPAPNQFAERQQATYSVASAYPASATQFVIQPQTYIAGAGGQTFTVPVPVPVEQAVVQNQHHHQQQQQQARVHHQYQQQQQQQHSHSQHSGPSHNSHNHNRPNSNQPTIADRMKQAFNQNFNRKMLERVETNAVVPALASTGLFLGLSALAAGWYLSKSNREVGIVRRTGKFSKKSGSPSGNSAAPDLKEKEVTTNTRTRRDLASMITPAAYQHASGGAPEVDQATFFQSIIQQSLEKTQKEYEDQVEPVYSPSQDSIGSGMKEYDAPMGYHRGEPEPERHGPPSGPPPQPPRSYRSKYNRYDRPSRYYSNSRDDDLYDPANPRISKSQIQEKSGGWSVHSAKNFARVAIPAVVLTGAALGICAVIFGWYISGDNREIAFLESPTTNSIHTGHRRKRSLFGNTAWSDGWLIRTLKAIHGNPYDNMPAPTAKSIVPYPYFLEKDSSKTSGMEFKVSNNGIAGVIAGGAVLAVVALGLINSFSESSGRNLKTARYNHLLTSSGSSASFTNSKSSTNPLTHLRSPRNMAHFDNDLEYQQTVSNPSFFESIVSSLEASGETVMNKLHELGSSNWHQSSCTKRVLCQVITSQGDDTVKLMEKKMTSIMKMLPDSVSSSINKNYSDVLAAIYKNNCAAFTCSSSSPKKQQPSVQAVYSKPSHPHHHKSSIKIEQTVTSSSR